MSHKLLPISKPTTDRTVSVSSNPHGSDSTNLAVTLRAKNTTANAAIVIVANRYFAWLLVGGIPQTAADILIKSAIHVSYFSTQVDATTHPSSVSWCTWLLNNRLSHWRNACRCKSHSDPSPRTPFCQEHRISSPSKKSSAISPSDKR
jgi:hypothetical protein